MALTREQSEGIKCDFDIRTFLCVNLEGGPWIFFCVYFCFSIFDLLSSVSLRKVASSYSDKIFIDTLLLGAVFVVLDIVYHVLLSFSLLCDFAIIPFLSTQPSRLYLLSHLVVGLRCDIFSTGRASSFFWCHFSGFDI